MASTPTNLDSNHFTTGTAPFVESATILPIAGKTHLAVCTTAGATLDCTVTAAGCGLTWTQVATVHLTQGDGSEMRTTLFQGTGTPSSGKVRFTFSTTTTGAHDGTFWSVTDWSEAPTVRNSGSTTYSGVNTPSIALPAFLSGDSVGVGWAYTHAGGPVPGSGWTELFGDFFAGIGSTDLEYKTNGRPVAWGLISDEGLAVAVELAPASTDSVGMIPI